MVDHDRFLEDFPSYEPEEGEEYMNSRQLEHFKSKLLVWKKALQQDAERTVNHIRSESQSFPDEMDRASMEEEFRVELRTRDRERKLMAKIDESLLRIEQGEYGYCKASGEEIGLARLDARPTADLSVEAKATMEQRERQGLPT